MVQDMPAWKPASRVASRCAEVQPADAIQTDGLNQARWPGCCQAPHPASPFSTTFAHAYPLLALALLCVLPPSPNPTCREPHTLPRGCSNWAGQETRTHHSTKARAPAHHAFIARGAYRNRAVAASTSGAISTAWWSRNRPEGRSQATVLHRPGTNVA